MKFLFYIGTTNETILRNYFIKIIFGWTTEKDKGNGKHASIIPQLKILGVQCTH